MTNRAQLLWKHLWKFIELEAKNMQSATFLIILKVRKYLYNSRIHRSCFSFSHCRFKIVEPKFIRVTNLCLFVVSLNYIFGIQANSQVMLSNESDSNINVICGSTWGSLLPCNKQIMPDLRSKKIEKGGKRRHKWKVEEEEFKFL